MVRHPARSLALAAPRGALRALLAALVIVSAVLGPAPGARADSTPAADFDLALSSTTPGTSTGMKIHVFFRRPGDAQAKPSPQRHVAIDLPAGSRIDGGAIPACAASDSELTVGGGGACPADTRIGTGTLTVLTGGGPAFDPFVDDVLIFNAGREWAELFTKHGTTTNTAVGRRRYSSSSTFTEDPGPMPGGPPDGESAVREFTFELPARVGPQGRPFITTPTTCPASGRWISNLAFTTADGHAYAVSSSTPCAAPRPPAACRRVFHVPLPRAARARGARVYVFYGGSRQRLLIGPRSSVSVNLAALSRGGHAVVVLVRARHGRSVVRAVHVYRTCGSGSGGAPG